MRQRPRMLNTLIPRVLRARGGGTAVEFALACPVLLLALLGVIEFGRVLWTQNALHYAVEQAARCSALNSSSCNSTTATQNYAASVSGLSFANPSSVFSTSQNAACGTGITGTLVSASYPFQFATSLFNYSLTLTAQACYPI